MTTPRFDLSTPVEQLHSNEQVKRDSRYLRGTIADSLDDAVTGAVPELDGLLTKFFGIYRQDNRDIREERRRARLEPDYQFMVRIRLPGGVCTPAQWLAIHALARENANVTLRLTTRQTFLFHGVRKHALRRHLKGIQACGLDTIAACGDDNRNVICTANPLLSPVHAQISAAANQLGRHLLPRTAAYRETFLDTPPSPIQDEEPLYGPTYLPRKFKIAIALPPHNDIDVFAHDLGFIAIVENGELVGYNVCVGGGMGMTHKMPATYPRLGDIAGFCEVADMLAVAEHTMCIQRDYGNRKDRAHARFKYTIADRGLDWFCNELARRVGKSLQPARAFTFLSNGDRYGWTEGTDGLWHYTLFVENGRLADQSHRMLMSGLRAIAAEHRGIFALTTNQNVTIAGVDPADRPRIQALLREYRIENEIVSPARQASMACVAFPTCALAMAESERYLPAFMSKLEFLLDETGLRKEPIVIRVSGCPNGCSRPYLAEIALVGKGPGRYNLHLGGGPRGDRLNVLHAENLSEQQILDTLRPVLLRFATERQPQEAFGDFVSRMDLARRHTADLDLPILR